MQQPQFESLDIPLSKLLAWDGNVRTSSHDEELPELAASIASHGILQNLVVKQATKAKYFVVAGGRRLSALFLLRDNGTIRVNYAVPCRLVSDDADATEISLAENQHKPMHPADEFFAFASLIENGHAAADVAARFGVTERVVLRRLALARVSPQLIALYRENVMPLEYLEAFAITSDHAAQEQVWDQICHHRSDPRYIKQLLSREDVLATDPRARFVTITGYEEAGGIVKRDLFAEGEQGVYLSDVALLNRLCTENLQSYADSLTQDGWKWVHFQLQSDPQFVAKHKRLQGKPIAMDDEQKAAIEVLEESIHSLQKQVDRWADDDDDDYTPEQEAISDELDEQSKRLRSLQQRRCYQYAKKIKTACGVFFCLDPFGAIQFIYGLVRKEDEALILAPDPTS